MTAFGLRKICLCVIFAGCTGSISGVAQRPGSGGPSNVPGGSVPPLGDEPKRACRSPAPRIWHLTANQYGRTLQHLAPDIPTPAVQDLAQSTPALGGVFSNQAAANVLSEPYVAELYAVANTWAQAASKSPEKLNSCATNSINEACANALFRGLLQKSQRHPVDNAAVQRTVDFYKGQRASETQEKALELTLLTVAMAPDMLFRTELGDDQADTRLAPYEMASAIAYTLTDSPPDEALLASAEIGELQTPAGIESQARRLLEKPENAGGAKRFLYEHFELKKVGTTQKDAIAFPLWNNEVAHDVAASTERFVEDAVWNQGGTMKALLTSQKAFVNSRIAPFYNVTVGSPEMTAVVLPTERKGLLTLPGVLALHAHPNRSSIVFRGKFILERMLCQKLTPPPQVPPIPQAQPGLTTQRERLVSITGTGGCAACHTSLNEMGFPFERFDGVGRARDTEDGALIVTSGKLMTSPALPVPDAPSFAQALADSSLAEQCLAQQAVTFVYGHPNDADNDDCAQQEARAAVATQGSTVLEALVKSLSAATFAVRKTP
jgi:Protein of unknown function (DUF1592)/Protein of unknown function (DUF1588)